MSHYDPDHTGFCTLCNQPLDEAALQSLLQTATRCEKEQPSLELDGSIALVVGWKMVGTKTRYWLEPGVNVTAAIDANRVHRACPRFTASLDAAKSLVLSGLWREQKGPKQQDGKTYWECYIKRLHPLKRFTGHAGTEALAMCAAALRARVGAMLRCEKEP